MAATRDNETALIGGGNTLNDTSTPLITEASYLSAPTSANCTGCVSAGGRKYVGVMLNLSDGGAKYLVQGYNQDTARWHMIWASSVNQSVGATEVYEIRLNNFCSTLWMGATMLATTCDWDAWLVG